MRKILLTIGAAATLASGIVASTATTASADPWRGGYRDGGWHGGGDRWRQRNGWRNHGGDALAAGAIGLGIGALLGTALTSRPYDDGRSYGNGYYDSGDYGVLEGPAYVERRVYYRPAPVYREVRPARYYSRVDACAARYRTYDYRTNTFVGYDGYRHECRL